MSFNIDTLNAAYSIAIVSLATTIGVLWKKLEKTESGFLTKLEQTEEQCREDRLKLWDYILNHKNNCADSRCPSRTPIQNTITMEQVLRNEH